MRKDYDFKCPHCDAEISIDNDHTNGWDCNSTLDWECYNCENTIKFHMEIQESYHLTEEQEADYRKAEK